MSDEYSYDLYVLDTLDTLEKKIAVIEAENAKLRAALNDVHILARCAPRGSLGYIISVDCMETVRTALEATNG